VADLTKTVALIFEAVNKTGGVLGGIGADLKDIDGNAGGASDGLKDVGNELDNFKDDALTVGNLTNAIKLLAASIVVKEFIDANVNAEQFRRTLELSTGSAEAAALEYEYIKDTAERLGLELQSTASAYAKFNAATKGSAIEGEATRVIFEAFAGTLSTVGATSDDISGALVQLSQGISKGKFELEDLKSIAERVPGFFTNFAAALGITTEELFDLVSAGQITGREILIFAQSLNENLAGVDFDGFTQSLNRFKNAQTDAFVILGDAGAFDVFTKGLQAATASVVGAIAFFQLLGEVAGSVAGALVSGNFSLLGSSIDDAMEKAANKTRLARDRLFELRDETAKAAATGTTAGNDIAAGMEKAGLSAKELEKASKDVDASLKELGIKPDQFEKPVEAIIAAFEKLASNPAARGDQILAGLLVTLDKIASGPEGAESIDRVRFQIEELFQSGRLSAEQYGAAVNAVAVKQDGLWDGMIRTTDAGKKQQDQIKKQAEEMKRAEEAARQYELKLLELASNERIKIIEARVELNIADLQEQTKRVEAAFASIDNTVNATSASITKLFELYSRNPSSGVRSAIEDQIEKENKLREDGAKLQGELIKAQINALQARTERLSSGNPLIEIDGAGLQPHLEAFMWEILRTIQTRVNEDGLQLLLGMNSEAPAL
jgi:tape measure domain-containing protein